MKKEEIIKRYGEEAYEKQQEQMQAWRGVHPGWHKQWRKGNPDKVIAANHNVARKNGKYYERRRKHQHTGIPGERKKIRGKHQHMWRDFKNIIAPNSQLHHQWLPGTSEYKGVALVETDQHRHGSIDVIHVLDGKITIFTEREIRNQVVQGGNKRL